jgi:DNA-binding transcriptional MerR regulator
MKRLNLEEFNKLYYSIGEVAELFQVNTSLIRFWEKEFTVLKPKKNKKGNRMFTVKDIANIEQIYILVKERGYTLDGAKKALKNHQASIDAQVQEADRVVLDDRITDVLIRLESIKQKLVALKQLV